MEKLAINVKELAEVLGVGISTAYDMIHIEGFPSIKAGGKYIIPVKALQTWLDKSAGGEFLI